ncbi:hypothetical protein LCGC14_0831640 [marine sediment metagenome]|uniref:Uncharacterized protein n=1 Tax=marine sediment metagenome TaxID=412755 RepID=A0A0F9PFN2_9ZZZZ
MKTAEKRELLNTIGERLLDLAEELATDENDDYLDEITCELEGTLNRARKGL